jgi:hypothetical protein
MIEASDNCVAQGFSKSCAIRNNLVANCDRDSTLPSRRLYCRDTRRPVLAGTRSMGIIKLCSAASSELLKVKDPVARQ